MIDISMSLERVVHKTFIRCKVIRCNGPQIRMWMSYHLSKSAKADETVHVHLSTLHCRGRGSQGPADSRTLLERPIFQILASLFDNRNISSSPFTNHNERNTSEALAIAVDKSEWPGAQQHIQESCSTMLNSDECRPDQRCPRIPNPERWRDEFSDKITRNQSASDGITSQDIRGPLPLE